MRLPHPRPGRIMICQSAVVIGQTGNARKLSNGDPLPSSSPGNRPHHRGAKAGVDQVTGRTLMCRPDTLTTSTGVSPWIMPVSAKASRS